MPSIQPILNKRQGALSGVTSGASDAGKAGYNSIKSATSSLSPGQIAGAIVAIVIGFALICFMLWYLCTRRLRTQRSRLNASEHNPGRQPMMAAAPQRGDRPPASSNAPYGFGGIEGGQGRRDERRTRYKSGMGQGKAAPALPAAVRGRDFDASSEMSASTEALTSTPARSDSRLDALDGGRGGAWKGSKQQQTRASRSYAQI